MSVSVHETRKSRSSTGSMNISVFHKASHPDCVLAHLNTLRKHCMFTDVTLWAGDRAFPCHRAVLAASSRYFEAMFSHGLRESRDDTVNFQDNLHPEVLELLLDFAYSSRIVINEENAESLLEAGDMLQFHDVRDAAAEFLEKNLSPSPSVSLKQVEKYDPGDNKWTMVAPMRDGVSNAAVVSAKLKLFVFGGTSIHRDMVSKVQCFDPSENRWTIKAECPQPWRYTAAAVLGSQIFIMGGDTEYTAASAYRFDCETNQWTRIGDMTAKRMSCHAVASGNKLYVVGGYFGTQRCKTLDCYDPTSDTWNCITTVPYSLIPTAFVSTWKHLPA